MSIEKSAIASLLCLAIAINALRLNEISETPSNVVFPNETLKKSSYPINEAAETWTVPIQSRLIKRRTYLKVSPSYLENSTSFVTNANNRNVDKSDSPITTKLPISLGDYASPKIVDFKPSIHMGEIDEYESRKIVNANNSFDNVKRVKFDDKVKIGDTDRVRVASSREGEQRTGGGSIIADEIKKIPVGKFFEADGRYGVPVPIEIVHQQQEYFERQPQLHLTEQQIDNDRPVTDNSDSDHYHQNNHEIAMGHESLMTYEYPRSPGYVISGPINLGRPVYTSTINEYQAHHPQDYEMPHENVDTIYVKPSKFHVQSVTHSPIAQQHYATPDNGASMSVKPEVHGYQNNRHVEGNYQHILPIDTKNIGKPETVLYLTSHRQTAFTRTRKFPYKFYDPSIVGQQDNGYHYIQEGQHGFPSKEQRVSPWKKIIHLIGAFLPLGLLLATLKPNIVKIENTTQPNIVLSKLRVDDMPAEHKHGRLVEPVQQEKYEVDTCDDRSICELIVSGSEPSSNLLQSILWNLSTKSTDEQAQKHGLDEIFAAAKRKDCSSIDC